MNKFFNLIRSIIVSFPSESMSEFLNSVSSSVTFPINACMSFEISAAVNEPLLSTSPIIVSSDEPPSAKYNVMPVNSQLTSSPPSGYFSEECHQSTRTASLQFIDASNSLPSSSANFPSKLMRIFSLPPS